MIEPLRRAAAGLLLALATLVWSSWVVTLTDTPLHAVTRALAAASTGEAALRVEVAWRDAEGERPLPEALVRVFTIGEEGVSMVAEEQVGADGALALEGLPSGPAWVLAYHEGGSRASRRVVLAPSPPDGSVAARLVLGPASRLAVAVLGPSDAPVERATITVEAGDELPFVASTDASGRADFERLAAAPARVHVSKAGFEEATLTVAELGALVVVHLERAGSLRVAVVDVDGAPVEGATVSLAGPQLWPARSLVTDASGSAVGEGLPSGSLDLQATKGSLVSPVVSAVVTRGVVATARLVVAEGRTFVVRVTDGDEPDAPGVAGAAVVVAVEGVSAFPLEAVTGDAGYAYVGPLAAGRASLSARAEGFVPRVGITISAEDDEVQVALDRGGTLRGRVVDDRGYPVAAATIEVVGTDPWGMPIDELAPLASFRDAHFEAALSGPSPLLPVGELGVTLGPIPDIPREGVVVARPGVPWATSRAGLFVATPITPGRVQAIVRHPDFVDGLSEVVALAPGGEAEVEVVLRPGGVLEGRVLEEDRSPVVGARVVATSLEGSFQVATRTLTDGTFSLPSVPAEVSLSVSRAEAQLDSALRVELDVEPRGRREVEIVLAPVRDAARVRVVDEAGFAVPAAEVRVTSLDLASDLMRTLFSDDEGEVEVPDAVGLELRLVVQRPGFAPSVWVTDGMPELATVTLSPGLTLVGSVSSGGREVLEGVAVTLAGPAGPRRTLTDEEGRFRFADVAPGRARLRLDAPGHVPSEVTEDVVGDARHDVDLGELELEPAGSVAGVVKDARGEPVAGARVAWGPVPSFLPAGPLPPFVALTDRRGRFTLSGLPSGALDLEASLVEVGRGEAADVRVRAGQTTSDVEIELDAAEAPPAPKAGASVAITLAEKPEGVTAWLVPPGGEAEHAGVLRDDRLLEVNGRRVASIEAARGALTGPLGDDVLLTLERDGVRFVLRVRRERARR